MLFTSKHLEVIKFCSSLVERITLRYQMVWEPHMKV